MEEEKKCPREMGKWVTGMENSIENSIATHDAFDSFHDCSYFWPPPL